jgi:hypothetical protein
MIDPILPQLDSIHHVISVYRWRTTVIPELEDRDLPVVYRWAMERPSPGHRRRARIVGQRPWHCWTLAAAGLDL